MNEKMKGIINTNLEVLEIYANKLLERAKENSENSAEMEKSIRILNVIGSDMERLQRLQFEKPLDDYSVSYDITQEDAEKPLTLEEEAQLDKARKMFRFAIEKQEEPGVIRLVPMNGDSFITLHGESDAKLFTNCLMDCFRKE